MFHRVQVSQMIHLRCLTETDRQKIRATCTNEGNNMTTFEFFQRLCCREGWVPQFVEALREQNMGDLADKLESVYHANLLPRPIFPSQLAASPANPPPQDTGDYRTPVQENSHPAEKSKSAVHPESADKGEAGFSSTSDGHSASDIGAAAGRDRAPESQDLCLEEAQALPFQGPMGRRPLRPPTTSTSAAGGPVEQKWDGRQHRPVTVKNGRFGNVHHPDDGGTVSTLPAGASGNQPEEDDYLSDSVLLPLANQREDLVEERKVHVLRGDRKQENPPVVDPSPRSAEDQMRVFTDPSSRSSPANGAQPSFTQTGAKPRRPVPSPMSEHPIRLPPSVLNVSSSVETKPPKPCVELSAGGKRSSDDVELPVEEKRSWGQTTVPSAVAGRPQESRPSAIRDCQRYSHIFYSNCGEDHMPSKPGVLSSENTSEPSKLCLDDTGEASKLYSGSSERLRMSDSDSILGSASNSDPILVSNSTSAGNLTPSTAEGSSRAGEPLDASLPPEVDPGEEDTSLRSHHVRVEENRSVDLMGVPLDVASSRPSPRAFPDSTSGGQPKNEAKNQAGPCLPEEKSKVEVESSLDNFWLLLAGFVLASVAAAAFALYKKK
ncbi:hypothetical protein Chor_001537 [Crotalus horridus]